MTVTESEAMRQHNEVVNNFQAHADGTAAFPMVVLNGYLKRKQNRLSPESDADHSPREFRRFVNASGVQDVQIKNGLWGKTTMGRRQPIDYVDYLYAANPRIPGQRRDDIGGKHKRGIDPQSWQALVDSGPGSQPVNPGGPGQMVGDSLWNPGTS